VGILNIFLEKCKLAHNFIASVGENNVECRVKPKAMGFSEIKIAQDGAKQKPNSNSNKAHDQESFIESKD
jgi:hypothetical protein